MRPDIRYARTADGVHVGYAVIGEGPPLVFCPPMVWCIEWAFEDPACARFLERLASFSRLILFDKRGSGHSDPLTEAATLEERAEDVVAVMDATMTDGAHLFGCSEGGSVALMFAASYPERTNSLITWSTFVRAAGHLADGAPFIAVPELLELWVKDISETWGTGRPLFGEWTANSPEARSMARRQQLSMSPGMARATAELNSQIDVRPILDGINVPGLMMCRTNDATFRTDHARYIADRVGGQYLELPGREHFPWAEDAEHIVAETQEFVTGVRPERIVDRVLATVMFTDVVGSTDHAVRVGDPSWKNLIDRHNALVREAVERARGTFVRATGDGALATFQGPSRAVHCGKDIIDALASIGLECRVGLHAGEIELTDDDIAGVAVHIADRVTQVAGAREVVVSSTVRDLSVGSGIYFHDLGEHDLKGVPDRWHLFRAKIA